MIKRFFITGTDTNIGKTTAACALLQAAGCAGYRTAGYKPVASGSELTPIGPRNSDALALMANANVTLAYHQVNPLTFIEPTSPHIASLNEGQPITAAKLSEGLRHIENSVVVDWLIIEGAGGWLTPLGEAFYYSDWVISESLPIILVVGMRLGCINHALLTALAVRQSGLCLAGWIANYHIPINYKLQNYITSLQERLNAPLIGEIPWLRKIKTRVLANYINLSLL